MTQIDDVMRADVQEHAVDGPRGKFGVAIQLWCARVVLLTILLGSWEVASGWLVDPFWVSAPTAIFARLKTWIADGSLWFHIWITMQEMVVGFALGSVSGILVGFVLGRNEFLSRVLDIFIVAIYCLPKVALAPLFILWFGIGMAPKIVLAAVIVFFLVFYNTFAGTRDVDRDLIDTVRLMRGSRTQILVKVIAPSAVVWIFTGLKMAVPYALMGAVVGEMMASNKGLGSLIEGSAGQFDTAGVFAALFVLMIIATILNEGLQRCERLITRWKTTGR